MTRPYNIAFKWLATLQLNLQKQRARKFRAR